MSLTKALRTALLTAAVAGAAVLGTQAAHAEDVTTPSGTTQTAPAAPLDGAAEPTPTPTPSATNNDPWD
ncbi:hypothetical protein R6L23_19520 [Streptomyces sp. SR27]|uniref:hypothetical protein n=1 Tax=unclassified Streptomyces TaxID=2593676 RepID=UPI00295AD910|nr:hypothetical protein [Streptomyces sp. SR27]MDV9190375.1 hypothetical protein [Streptomyces sp. SR27]